MDPLPETWQEAMQIVAERRLFAQMRKEADAESAGRAQSARQTLGVLGADEAAVNSALTSLRRGEIWPWRARRQMQGAVPSAMTQLGNLPAAVATAARQGRAGDVAAQIDVPGLKQLSPWSDNFSPTTALASLGLGAGTAGARHVINKERGLWDVLHGTGAATGANDVLVKAPGVHEKAVAAWRKTHTRPENPLRDPLSQLREAWHAGGPQPASAGLGPMESKGGLGWRLTNMQRALHDLYHGSRFSGVTLPEVSETKTLKPTAKHLKLVEDLIRNSGLQAPKQGVTMQQAIESVVKPLGKAKRIASRKPLAPSMFLDRDRLVQEWRKLPKTPMGRLAAFGLPAAAAAAPLVAREWFGRGYRSGSKPIETLVENAKPKG